MFDNLNMFSDAGEDTRQSQGILYDYNDYNEEGCHSDARPQHASGLMIAVNGKGCFTIHYPNCTLYDDNQS
jgi:hypothetical protein